MKHDNDDEYEHEEEGYIVEFIVVGNAMKVTAVDVQSLREVSMVGDPKMPRKYLAKLEKEKPSHG